MKKLLILCLTFTIATELEVDGRLKVTGDIDASGNPVKNIGLPTTLNDAINGNALQNALRDDGPYEIEYYQVWFENGNDDDYTFDISYRGLGQSSFTSNWQAFLNQKSIQGWSYNYIPLGGSTQFCIYKLFRKIEDSE